MTWHHKMRHLLQLSLVKSVLCFLRGRKADSHRWRACFLQARESLSRRGQQYSMSTCPAKRTCSNYSASWRAAKVAPTSNAQCCSGRCHLIWFRGRRAWSNFSGTLIVWHPQDLRLLHSRCGCVFPAQASVCIFRCIPACLVFARPHGCPSFPSVIRLVSNSRLPQAASAGDI